METIKAIKMVKEKLGCKTILGVSNISFGIPNRQGLNNTYLNLALGSGLDLPIINTEDKSMVESVYAYKVISNIDRGCLEYIEKFRDVSKDNKQRKSKNHDNLTLEDAIERGLKDEAKDLTLQILSSQDEHYVLDEVLIPALDVVGSKYDKGELFLPQMIQSAETVKVALNIIKQRLSKNNNTSSKGKIIVATVQGDIHDIGLPQMIQSAETVKVALNIIKQRLSKNNNTSSKGKIIVATVQGDIHDIGKNIVKIMLENYGYEVIDLGKDVPIEEVVNRAKEENIELIGLSALMTTTVENMKKTISALKENGVSAKVFVGGAVVTEEYAQKINADYYSKDAKSAVEIAKINFNNKI